MENSSFVSDTELTDWVNHAGAELHDLLVDRYEDYFTTSVDFTISSGNTYTLPSGFLKLRGLDYQLGTGDWVTLKPFNFQDRNLVEAKYLYDGNQGRRYRMIGNTLHIYPTSQGPGSYRLWYVANYTPLSADADIFLSTSVGDLQRWYQYVVIDAAIRCLQKEESWEAVTALQGQKAAMIDRIRRASSGRDASVPERVTMVRRYGDEDSFYDE
jgi:hypothetical protein